MSFAPLLDGVYRLAAELAARPYLDEHVGVDWLNSAAPARWVGLSAAYKERHG